MKVKKCPRLIIFFPSVPLYASRAPVVLVHVLKTDIFSGPS